MTKGLALLLVIASALTVPACATRPAAPPVSLAPYTRALVTVSGASPQAAEHAPALQDTIVQRLRAERLFEQVDSGAAQTAADLGIRVKILDVKRVSDLERIDLGRVAGSNEVHVEVDLSDARGMPLTTFQLRGTSPRWSAISAEWPWGSLETAMQRVADEVTRRLRKWRE